MSHLRRRIIFERLSSYIWLHRVLIKFCVPDGVRFIIGAAVWAFLKWLRGSRPLLWLLFNLLLRFCGSKIVKKNNKKPKKTKSTLKYEHYLNSLVLRKRKVTHENLTLIKLSFGVSKNLILITEDVIVDVELVRHWTLRTWKKEEKKNYLIFIHKRHMLQYFIYIFSIRLVLCSPDRNLLVFVGFQSSRSWWFKDLGKKATVLFISSEFHKDVQQLFRTEDASWMRGEMSSQNF